MAKNLFAAVLICAATLAAQDLKLIPLPQSVKTAAGQLMLRAPVRIGVASASEADRFAAQVLIEDLKQVAHLDATLANGGGKKFAIVIGKPGDRAIDAEIARLKLDTSTLGKSESYLLNVSDSGVLIAAQTDEGVFYGVQTLRQLVQPGIKGATIPYVTIADWPALRYRGISVDISRGPILNDDQILSMIRRLAAYKLNMLSFYMEHVFPYKASPMVAPEGGEFPAELLRRFVDYAGKYHVEIVPQQQTFGHLHHMLKLERYADMAEVPHGHVLAAESPQAYEWIKNAVEELAGCTKSRFLHIGSDETNELGQGRSKGYAERVGVGQVYMDHMRKVDALLKPLNRTLMFWGDIALHHPDLVPTLPKDMVAMTWVYDPKENFDSYILPFKNAGLQFFVCPGVNNWNRIFPNLTNAIGNINNFVRDGKRYGALGMFNTEWADDGEALFNMTWYANVFSAAASWQSGTVDVEAFDRAFDWAFYRSTGGQFAKAIRNLDRIHGLLGSVGAGDGNDDLTWFDPFSRLGAGRVKKIAPVAAEIRKAAEDVYIQVTAQANHAVLNQDTLPLITFAAKRFDYAGMRVQFASEMAEAYRNKRPGAARERAVDLRDSINDLKVNYRKLWLAENRPYWIDNVLIKYENEALYWVRKAGLIGMAAEDLRTTKVLPDPEAIGLFLQE